jgi:hypothetical protein
MFNIVEAAVKVKLTTGPGTPCLSGGRVGDTDVYPNGGLILMLLSLK